jgi:hypothetical protein
MQDLLHQVFSGQPTRKLRPYVAKDGTVTVQFAKAIWSITATVWNVTSMDGHLIRRADGRRYRAQVTFVPKFVGEARR